MENKVIISKKEKEDLFYRCIPVNIEYFEEINLQNNNQFIHLSDLVSSLRDIQNTGKIKYKHAFFFTMGASGVFKEIEKKYNDGVFDLSHIKDPKFWEQKLEKRHIYEAVFFSYRFLQELYGEQLKEDMLKLEKLESANDYMKFRKEIKKKKLH